MAKLKFRPIPELTQVEIERFWSHVSKSDGCWIWTASGQRYGKAKIRRVNISSHRLAYHIGIGPIPEGKLVCHTCDNQKCCRPDHLFAGTTVDNSKDMLSKGRGNKASGPRHGSHIKPERFDNPGPRLTRKQILSIVADAKLNTLTNAEIARKYEVGKTTVLNILSGKTWSNITKIQNRIL